MKEITIQIDNPDSMSLNKYRSSHWSVWNSYRDSVFYQLKSKINNIKITHYPIHIDFVFEKLRPFDCDNIILKPWIDALIHLKVIENDSPRYIKSVTITSRSSKRSKVTIKIKQGLRDL